jgi:hypothetical protein
MNDSWKDDNCAAIKAHYAVLSVPRAAALWCGDDIEQNSHTAISAEAYRALKAERDTLNSRLDDGLAKYNKLRQEKESIEAERDALKLIADNVSPAKNGEAGVAMSNSRHNYRDGSMSIMTQILKDAYRKAGYLEDAKDDAADAEELARQARFLKQWATPENMVEMFKNIDRIEEATWYLWEEYAGWEE